MSWMGEWGRRMAMLFDRQRFRDDLDAEMRLHMELRRRQQMERGLGESEALAAAHRRFGSMYSIKERSQRMWGWGWLESLMQDMVYGVRGLKRSPGISAVALLSLALGIGANTAIFSLIDAVLLRSLPVKDPGRLVMLGDAQANGITIQFGRTDLYSYPVYRALQKQNQVFSDMAAIFSLPNDVYGYVDEGGQQEPMHVQLVSGTYFETLGVQAQVGRLLRDGDDDSEGDHPVAVVSDSWWKRRMERDPAVLGKTLRIGSTVFSIAGVAPKEFFGTKVGKSPDIWIPLSMMRAVPPHWGSYSDAKVASLYLIGRLKPDVTAAQAAANMTLLFRQIFAPMVGDFPYDPSVEKNTELLKHATVLLTPMATGISDLRHEFSDPLRFLMAVVALVLIIACANIANLLLARSTARARELAVRQALGAGRSRIVRQLLTESLVLAAAGGALGVVLAAAGSRLLVRLVSTGGDALPLDVSIHAPLLAFTLAVTVATALLFGAIPAFRATRLQLTDSLKSGRGATGAATKGVLAKALIVSQVAISLVLMVSAWLFLRSLVNLTHVDTGFNRENILLFQVDVSSAGYQSEDPRLPNLYRQTQERVAALPGVVAASFSDFTFHEGSWNGGIFVQGFDNNGEVNVKHNIVGQGYFATMGIPIVEGRAFGSQDTPTSPKVAIISEHVAKTLFPAGSPIGRHYSPDTRKQAGEFEVVGVAKDVKFGSLDEPTDWLDYYPLAQGSNYLGDFEVRYTGDAGAVTSAVRKTIHEIDPGLPVTHVETMDERIADTTVDESLVAELCWFFGLLAAFLSGIGIYGLMSYLVSRRANEIGIRMALGAERGHVQWLVMREIAVLVTAGLAAGVPIALIGGRYVEKMLFGLKPSDPVSLVAAVVLVLMIAAGAGLLPARRAARVEPAEALRCE